MLSEDCGICHFKLQNGMHAVSVVNLILLGHLLDILQANNSQFFPLRNFSHLTSSLSSYCFLVFSATSFCLLLRFITFWMRTFAERAEKGAKFTYEWIPFNCCPFFSNKSIIITLWRTACVKRHSIKIVNFMLLMDKWDLIIVSAVGRCWYFVLLICYLMGVRWEARTKFDSKNQWTETSDDDLPAPPYPLSTPLPCPFFFHWLVTYGVNCRSGRESVLSSDSSLSFHFDCHSSPDSIQ